MESLVLLSANAIFGNQRLEALVHESLKLGTSVHVFNKSLYEHEGQPLSLFTRGLGVQRVPHVSYTCVRQVWFAVEEVQDCIEAVSRTALLRKEFSVRPQCERRYVDMPFPDMGRVHSGSQRNRQMWSVQQACP